MSRVPGYNFEVKDFEKLCLCVIKKEEMCFNDVIYFYSLLRSNLYICCIMLVNKIFNYMYNYLY